MTVAASWSDDGCAVIGLVRLNLGMMEVAVVCVEFLWVRIGGENGRIDITARRL